MKKVYYKDLSEFESAIKPYRTIDCTEGTIYFTENYVYKILTNKASFCSPRLIKPLSKLDSTFLTVPKFLLYILDTYGKKFNKCAGFAMELAGGNLWAFLSGAELSFERKKDIAYQMKEICIYLRKKKYVHGDIKLENFLYNYKDGILRLMDINNMRKNPNITNIDKLRMPPLYDIWYKKCKDGFYVDYLATNYCMYILLNFDLEGIAKIITEYNKGFHYNYYTILDRGNRVFDNEIYEKMKSTMEHIEERKLTKEFLVDYLVK